MPEEKRPLKVFLCHAHSDKDKVRALYSRLKREGVDAWLDKEKLLPGSDWELEIRKAVREADVVVVCLSKQFNQAGFRQKEVRIALDTAMEQPEGEIFIIPARLDECETLESLRKWHWVDLFEEDGYHNLIRALRARADRIGATLRIRRGGQATTPRPKKKEPEKTAESPDGNVIVPDAQETQRLEDVNREMIARGAAEKAAPEKIDKEIQREVEKRIKKAKRDLRWEKFKINFRYRLDLIRIYRVPILILSIGLAIIIPLSVDLYNRFPELTQALNNVPTTTLTTHLIAPSQTLVPSQAQTKFPTLTLTPTKTKIPTLTQTFTPIPRSSILFQRDFEGGVVGEWSHLGGIWVVEQEPDGNDYLSGSSSEANPNPSQIQYTYQKTRWTDYALETRVKSVTGRTLYILIRSDVGSGEFYGIAINDSGFSFMRTWSMIGTNIPMTLAPNRWYTIRVEIKGDLLSAYIDDALFQELKLQPPLIDHGGIGFVIDGDKVYFDDIKAWSLK